MKESIRKGDVIQVRFDRTISDQLSALAAEEDRPLSAMVRSWVTDRLRQELSRVSSTRMSWQQGRLKLIGDWIKKEIPDGPILVVHGQPLTPGLQIQDLEMIKRQAPFLFPAEGIYQVTSRINRFGHESVMEKAGKTVSKSQIFRTSQVETIKLVECQKNEVFGLRLNESIILIIGNQFRFLHAQNFPLPYVFNISLLRFARHWFVTEPSLLAVPHVGFEEDEMTFADVQFTELRHADSDQSIARLIRPQLNEIWNASGYAQSPDFTSEGLWKGSVK